MMADKRQRAMASALMDENLLARLGQGYEAQPYGFTPSRFPRLQMQATTPAEAMNADGIGAFSPELSAGMVPPLAEQRTMSGAVDPGSIYQGQGSRPSFLANAIDAFRGRQTPSRPSALAQALAAGVPGGETISQFARDVYEGAATNRNGMFAPQPAKPVEPAQNNLSRPDYGTDERTSYSRLSNPDYGTDEPPTAAPTAAPPMPAPITIADSPVYEPAPVPEPPTRPPGLGANSISNSPYATNAQQGAFNAMDDRFSAQNFAYSGGGRPQPTPEAADGASQAATGARAGGSAAATATATGARADDTYTGAPRGLFGAESSNRFNAQNDVRGAGGMKGHFGRVQFGRARLQDAAAAGAIPAGTTPQQFMDSPELQRAAERWHFSDIDANIKASGIDRMIGQTINGVPVTRDGLVAVAHLGGLKGMRLFVETGGRYNPRDANGTSLMTYLSRFVGDSRPKSNMPAVTPGTGATQVPLTTAQAAPNTARPVAGDDPETLEADARYYEKTNPRAAAEFRARAEIARRKAAPRVAALSQHLRGTA